MTAPPDPVFPIVLSHVSSLWRAIALGFPRLWSSISIRFSGDIQPLGAKKLLESFLENSAECPLDLRVVVASEIATWRKHALSSWELLKRHYTRSENLVIENYSNFNRSAFDPFRGVASTEFGIFHHLLSFSYVEQSPPKSELNGSWWASPIAPRLAQVQVYNLYPSGYLPYSQLTKLIVDSLKVSKNLQFLQLSNLSDTQSSQVIPHRVELPFPHTFSIWYVSKQRQFVIMDNANLQALFSSLVMPVLSTFKLACRTSPVSGKFYWPSSLLTILRQSSTTLRNLTLALCPAPENQGWDSLSLLLEKTPHLMHFTWIEYGDVFNYPSFTFPDDFTSSILSDLIYTSDDHDGILLSELEQISLHRIKLTSNVLESTLKLANSRSPRGLSVVDSASDTVVCRPLKTVQVVYLKPTWAHTLSANTEEPLREAVDVLKREGVRVIFEKTNVRDYL